MANTPTQRAALLVATLSAFTTPFMGSAVNIALVRIQEEFSVHAVLLSWVATSYLLAAAVFLVPFGRLADLHGRKRVFTIGMAIFTLGSVLAGLAPSVWALLAARVVQGLGSAMVFATGIAILTSVFPREQRGRVLGINVAAVYVGLSVGPFLGGLLTEHLGWRSVFLSVVPLGLLVLGAVAWKLEGEWADARGERFDLPGSLLYGLAVVGVLWGVSVLPSWGGLGSLVAGGLVFLAFLGWEVRAEHPVFPVNLFRSNRVFAFSNLAALINYAASYAVTFLLSLTLQHARGLDPEQAGLVLVSQPVVMAALSPVAGRLSDRVEPRIVASVGMALTMVALVLLGLTAQAAHLVAVVAALVILGAGLGLFSSPNTNAILSSVQREHYGVASGSVGTMRLLGQVLSMGLATLLFAMFMGHVEIDAATMLPFLQSVRTTLWVAAGLCLLGLAASMVRGDVRSGA